MTTAQRARLVVALGVLNLVLATLAFAVGITAPTPPTDIAVAPSTPAPALTLPPAETPPPVRTPEPSERPGPTVTPPEATPTVGPTSEPSTIPVPTGVVIVANRPPAPSEATLPTPEPTSTATPPDPTPTAKPPKPSTGPPAPPPTAKPPKPAVRPQAHPPCPGTVEGPPGHSKGEPWSKPCGNGKGGPKDGIVIVLPLALGAAVVGSRRRIADSLRRPPSAR